MDINNAVIEGAKVFLDDRDRLSAQITFRDQCGCIDWFCVLTNSEDLQRLTKLMHYAGVREVQELNGKTVRVVMKDWWFGGFGHHSENKFVSYFTKEFMEITAEQFDELLNK